MPPSMTLAASSGSTPDVEQPKYLTGRCSECNDDNLVLDAVLARHFDLHVCMLCKQDRNLRFGWYELIPKTRAKQEFALPDSYFHGVPFVTKPNPRHESFAPLKLYLKKMLMDEVTRLYGGMDAMEKEKSSRKRKSYERAATRTKHVLKKRSILAAGASWAGNGDAQNGHTATTPLVLAVAVPVVNHDHQHQFTTEQFDEEEDSWVKECACGIRVHFEKW